MKPHLLLFALLLFPLITVSGQTTRREALSQLDKTLKQEEQLCKAKETRLDSLKEVLRYAEDDVRLGLYKEIHQEYFQYQNDSALHYAMLLHQAAVRHGDKRQSGYASNQIALCLGVMGAYLDTKHLLDSLRTTITEENDLVRYYHTCRTVYGWAASYLSGVPRSFKTYSDWTDNYRDSILLTDRDSIGLRVCLADKYLSHGQTQKAREILLQIEKVAQGTQKAYTHYLLAMTYNATGDEDNVIIHLAQTAICDLTMNKKEHAALLELAGVMYEQGDIERSYRYLMHALEDAAFCNARLRSVEVARIFPIISSSYQDMEAAGRLVKAIAYLASGLLFLCVIALATYLYRQIKKLRMARRMLVEKNGLLENANASLEGMNSELKAANKIKEQYISVYIERCRAYIENANENRKQLLKLATTGKYDALQKELKSFTYINKEKQLFYHEFDTAFLNIFPHFVENFNSIMQPDHQLVPKKDEHLTTELRIFALIRLGITDTSKIAAFLDYSIATIYQYWSRVRSNSVLSKEEFEERILCL